MNSIYVKARAKINLAIDIIGKRDDGYHEMDMIMQSISLYDGILMKKVNKSKYIKIISNLSWLPTDNRNIVYKAMEYMIERYKLSEGVFIELRKCIPVSAGLGGGSADCAAAMLGLRALFSLPVSNEELLEIGLKFGADVPFCIMKGTALARGIGELLTKVKSMPYAYVVLVKPPIVVSTAEVFKKYSIGNVEPSKKPDIQSLIGKIEAGDLHDIASEFRNVLESVTETEYPVISDIKNALTINGAIGSMMSGSGPTVFGLFENRLNAVKAAENIKNEFKTFSDIIVTDFYNN